MAGNPLYQATHPTFWGRGNNSPPARWDVEITCAQIQDNLGSGDRKVQLVYYYCDGSTGTSRARLLYTKKILESLRSLTEF